MVYLLVPTFRRVDSTKRFIESVRIHLHLPFRIILVDDDPDRSTTDTFGGEQSVTVLPGTGTLFWGGSMNVAIRHLHDLGPSDRDIVVFANNDVVLTDDTVPGVLGRLPDSSHLYHPTVRDQDGAPLSSGVRVITWVPYITRHPKRPVHRYAQVHLATARFLAMSYATLRAVGTIHTGLPQYQGDNEFSMRARRLGHRTFVVRDAECRVDERKTGSKNTNVASWSALLQSFFSIRSATNIHYRYTFLRACLPPILAEISLVSLTVNSIIRMTLNRVKSAF